MRLPMKWVWIVISSVVGLAQPLQLQDTKPSRMPQSEEHQADGADGLTLQAVLAKTLAENPDLKALAAEITAREGAAVQARLRPNPELELEAENLAGDDAFRGLDGSESTLSFSQKIELWGKRPKRAKVATLERDLADWQFQGAQWRVLANARGAFFELLLAQRHAALNERLLALAEKTASVVALKVEAGKVSPIEGLRAKVEVASARTDKARSKEELEIAKRRLAAYWGASETDFDRVTGELKPLSPPPAEAVLRAKLAENPMVRRWETETERQKARHELAKTEALPDLNLKAGVKFHNATDSRAFVFGVAVPIPIFNRNQGAISQALAYRDQAQHRKEAAKVELQVQLAGARQSLMTAYEQAVAYRDEILPLAQEAFEATDLGYRGGKLEFLDMLEAQRTLFDAKRQYLMILAEYHRADADLTGLIGLPSAPGQN